MKEQADKGKDQLVLISAFGRRNFLSNSSKQLEDALERYPEEAKMVIENSLINRGSESIDRLEQQYEKILTDFEKKYPESGG